MTSGDHLLFIHGWGFGPTIWDEYIKTFFSEQSLSSADLFEKTDNEDPGKPGHYFEKTVCRVADSLQEQTTVIAWSLGGQVAIELAAQHMKKIDRLVLLNCTPCFVVNKSWTHGISKCAIEKLLEDYKINPAKTLRHFCGLVAQGETGQRELLRLLNDVLSMQTVDDEVMLCWLQLLVELDLREHFRNLQLPIHILLTEHDALVSPAIKNPLLSLNKMCHIKVLDRCGHAPFLSRPEDTTNFIKNLMA